MFKLLDGELPSVGAIHVWFLWYYTESVTSCIFACASLPGISLMDHNSACIGYKICYSQKLQDANMCNIIYNTYNM